MTENREGTTNAVVELTLQQFPEKPESGDDLSSIITLLGNHCLFMLKIDFRFKTSQEYWPQVYLHVQKNRHYENLQNCILILYR